MTFIKAPTLITWLCLCIYTLLATPSAITAEPESQVNAVSAITPANTLQRRFLPQSDSPAADQPLPDYQPDFRRHVLPLLGRMGCNGRACHGSFQGQGGFRLSLFGYDLQADHEALTQGENPRVNHENPLKSLLLQKPSLLRDHEGGRRFQPHDWEWRVLRAWIQNGAKPSTPADAEFAKLEVFPREIVFRQRGDTTQITVIAYWRDGTIEDVTSLARFRTNDESIATIDEQGLITCVGPGDTHVVAFYDNGVQPLPVLMPVSEQNLDLYARPSSSTKIDELVLDKLSKLGIIPADKCDDAEFLRRVRLDLTGVLPLPSEVQAFTKDPSTDKRAKKIEELLNSPEYAAWWATKLSDLTGNNPRQTANQKLPQADAGLYSRQWYHWLHERVRNNTPYDKIVSGLVLAQSLQPGQSYAEYCQSVSTDQKANNPASYAQRETNTHYWARKNLRTTEDRVLGFSYTFLGIQIQCAQCHKHPFDQWTKQDFDQFKPFFDRITYGTPKEYKEESEKLLKELNLANDPKKNANEFRKELLAAMQAGKPVPQDLLYLRELPKPTLNKAEKKDLKAAGEKPANKKQPAKPAPPLPKLLGGDTINLADVPDPRVPLMQWVLTEPNHYLARAFVNRVWANYFNVGIIHPTDDANLANPPSNGPLLDYLTLGFIEHHYDMKWLHREICNSDTYQRGWRTNSTNKYDTKNFSRAIPRRLPAEVAYDAIIQSTAGSEELQTLSQKPLDRAIGLASTLAQLNGKLNYSLTVFGRPERSAMCDCERSNEPSLLQAVFTQNDGELLAQLDRNSGWIKELDRQWNPQPVAKNKVAARPANTKKAKPGKDKSAADQPAPNPAQADRLNLLELLERRIAKLQKAGKVAEADKLREKVNSLRESAPLDSPPLSAATQDQSTKQSNAASIASQPPPVSPVAKLPQAQRSAVIKAAIRQAYLRTLSREPRENEMERSWQYVNQAANPTSGMKDLLWTLINTKEFILNH